MTNMAGSNRPEIEGQNTQDAASVTISTNASWPDKGPSAGESPTAADGSVADKRSVPSPDRAQVDCQPSLAPMADQLARIEGAVSSISTTINDRLQYDQAKEAAFNRLYADLDAERARLAGEPLKPILRDLIRLYDHFQEAIRTNVESRQCLEMFREGLLEVLSRAGVEPIIADGAKFSRSTQSIRSVQPTADPNEDWTIAEVAKDGFLYRGQVLRPQQVIVRRIKVPLSPPPETPNTSADCRQAT
jgi:molecular chaperone GrpE (heat shock protein)